MIFWSSACQYWNSRGLHYFIVLEPDEICSFCCLKNETLSLYCKIKVLNYVRSRYFFAIFNIVENCRQTNKWNWWDCNFGLEWKTDLVRSEIVIVNWMKDANGSNLSYWDGFWSAEFSNWDAFNLITFMSCFGYIRLCFLSYWVSLHYLN